MLLHMLQFLKAPSVCVSSVQMRLYQREAQKTFAGRGTGTEQLSQLCLLHCILFSLLKLHGSTLSITTRLVFYTPLLLGVFMNDFKSTFY